MQKSSPLSSQQDSSNLPSITCTVTVSGFAYEGAQVNFPAWCMSARSIVNVLTNWNERQEEQVWNRLCDISIVFEFRFVSTVEAA